MHRIWFGWQMRPLLLLAAVLFVMAPATASADRFVDPGGPTFLSVGSEMVVFDGFVYFAANNGVIGNELWRTDGTAAGTTLVKDFYTGTAGNNGNPSGFRVVGNRLYFNVGNDGVDSGLVVYFLEPGGTPQRALLSANVPARGPLLGAVNGKVLLRQLENSNTNYGLYALGATGSTFGKISAGTNNIGTEPYAVLNGKAYFDSATGPNSASEPWVTDGTAKGTVKLKEIFPGAPGSDPRDFVATTNRVYFTADDGTRGRELWATNGTDAGTTLVYEHHPLSTGTGNFGVPVARGDTLYYLPNDPATGYELWRTQGTAATTSVVKDITPGSGGQHMTLFAFQNGVGMLRGGALYVSDGTGPGTTLLGQVDGDGYGPDHPLATGGHIYFRGGFSPFGGAVWRSDGTPGGTFALTAGPFDGATSGAPMAGPFVQLGSKVIFTAHYPHPPGDGIPGNARRIYFLDTTQPDETRQATAAPSIAGTPTVGQKLTGNRGTWTRESTNKYAYEWLRNGTPIPNATGTEYTPQAADAGTQISLRVTASGIGGPNRVSAESAAVTVSPASAAAPPAPRPAPTPPRVLGQPAGGDRTAPRLSAVSLARRIRSSKTKKARLRLSLSEAATVTITLQRAVKGKRKGSRCVAGRGRPRCTRLVTAGTVRGRLPAGAGALALGRRLSKGSYRATVIAVDAAGNRSAPTTVTFTVTRR